MARRAPPEVKIDGNRWLTTYADLMNNLLVMFIMLYAVSVIDLTKYEKLVISFSNTFGSTKAEETTSKTGNLSIDDITLDQINALQPSPTPLLGGGKVTDSPAPDWTPAPGESPTPEPEPTPTPAPTPTPGPEADPNAPSDEIGEDEYDELVARISALLKENGYDEHISVEKSGNFIYLRFREGVLFQPDQSVMREGATTVLSAISEVIMDSYDLISNIDISGHTARIPYDLPTKDNLFSWELSTNRALTVLEFLVRQCDVPQEKLSVTGYSCNRLYVQGNTEEYWAQNRRVEIRLTKADSAADSQAAAKNPEEPFEAAPEAQEASAET